MAVAVAVRLPGIGASLWYDELWATRIKVGELHLLLKTLYHDAHPPLHLGLMWLSTVVVGDSEFAIRGVSLAFGVAAVVMLRSLALRYLSPWGSLLPALLLALSPAHVWCSQAARSYAMGVFCALWAGLCLERMLERPGARGRFMAYSVSVLLVALVHFYGVASHAL